MGMVNFGALFPEVEVREIRSVTPVADSVLPQRSFAFVELYCREPACDCRRVMINVMDVDRNRHVATINHGFEPPEPRFADEGQTFLDPLNPQTRWSAAFLGLFVEMLEYDPEYGQRLERHYAMWKHVVNDPAHPGQSRLPVPEDGAHIAGGVSTVRRASAKVGMNELCPCGSGRKYKRCCRD
jgi:hypothetical protein